ncbi:MAG: GGDEF domain-containing response regulator [Candidatus Acidiferrales bacterium]
MSTAVTKILLVEDNHGDARLIEEALSEIGKWRFELVHCETLAQALEFCSSSSPDAVLLDLGLPDAQGLETVRRIHGAAQQTPLVVLTVSNDEDLAIKSLHEGAQDYLPKGQIDGGLIWRALRYAMERQRLQLELLNLSLVDELTGLNNRRGFLALGEHHIKVARRSGMTFMVAFADLDGLKTINDTFGHQEGNRALVEAANLLRDSCRRSDILSRIGGDEFAILIADVDKDCADVVLRRIQKKLDSCNANPGRGYPLSLSVGIVAADGTPDVNLGQLLQRADELMYVQKQKKKLPRCSSAPFTPGLIRR